MLNSWRPTKGNTANIDFVFTGCETVTQLTEIN